MQLPEITARKILGLIVLCLIVGFVMVKLGITPDGFWRWVVGVFEWFVDLARSILSDGLTYLLWGAAVVVPIYGIIWLTKVLKKKKS